MGKINRPLLHMAQTDMCVLEGMMISRSPVNGLWAWTRQIKYFIRFISGTRPNGEQKSQC